MKSNAWRLGVLLAGLALLTGSTAATARPSPRQSGIAALRGADVSRVEGSGAPITSIRGAAWTIDNAPIVQARIRLRNVVTGKVAAVAVSNDAGQFTFDDVPGGSYLVELLDDAGRIRAVGHVFTIAPGETVATFVRTGAKAPWFSGFFSNSAAAVAMAAASQGVTAIAPVVRAVSPNQ